MTAVALAGPLPAEPTPLGVAPSDAASFRIIDDRAVLQRISEGDREALATLYRRHAPALLGYLRRLAGDPGVAEEILQDTFLAVWSSAASFEGRAAVRTWCYGIARRQAHNRLRRLPPPLPVDPDTQWSAASDSDPGPEELSLSHLSAEQLGRLIHQLSPVHQEILHLSLATEVTTDELATLLEVPPGTVKSRLSNARRALRQLAVAQGILP